MGNYRYSWSEEDPRIKRIAWIVTLVAQGVLLLILLLLGFVTPLPLPGEEGVAVAFGDELGTTNPRVGGAVMRPVQPEPVPTPTREPETPLTQDYEEAPSLPTPPPKPEIKPKPEKPKEPVRQPETAEPERTPEPQRQADPNALFTGAVAGNPNGDAQGGEQKGLYNGTSGGDPEGSGSGTHGSGSSQGAGGKDGISYQLGSRRALRLPPPVYPTEKSGRVVVKVWVDRTGHVVQAEPGERGTTTFDEQLMEAARQAALRANFDVDSNAPTRQIGTITYVFRLTQKG